MERFKRQSIRFSKPGLFPGAEFLWTCILWLLAIGVVLSAWLAWRFFSRIADSSAFGNLPPAERVDRRIPQVRIEQVDAYFQAREAAREAILSRAAATIDPAR